jgi:hypothetical protein
MESKLHENLYFMRNWNIDAITGGLTFRMLTRGLFWWIIVKALKTYLIVS